MATAVEIRVQVPTGRTTTLLEPNRPYVLLELGNARVTPAVERDLSSWVHDRLAALSLAGEFVDNRPRALRCLHPWVTACEKLDAISRRWNREPFDPAGFARHDGDLSSIVAAEPPLAAPVGFATWAELAQVLHVDVDPTRAAFDAASEVAIHAALARAVAAIAPMFWGPQETLPTILATLRAWLRAIADGAEAQPRPTGADEVAG